MNDKRWKKFLWFSYPSDMKWYSAGNWINGAIKIYKFRFVYWKWGNYIELQWYGNKTRRLGLYKMKWMKPLNFQN